MSDNRGALIAWSAGVSAVAAAFAGILASRATTPLSHNPWFIVCVAVACLAFAILVVAGLALLVSWWRSRQPHQFQAAEEKRRALAIVQEVGGHRKSLPRVREVSDRGLLGIHPAIPLPGEDSTLSQEFPLYVARDVDPDLDAWISNHRASGGFLLLVGPAVSGKTRAAYELIHRTIGDWRMFMPTSATQLSEYIESTADTDALVVWLNEIQNFLGPDGLTSAVVRRILADKRPVILLATIWPDRYEALTEPSPGPGPTDPNRDAREILGMLADRKDLLSEFTGTEYERARALASRDPRIAEVVHYPNRGEVAALLAAAPELARRWTGATNPYGAAVISAAVCARLCGYPELLPNRVLEALADCFLTGEQRAQLSVGSWFSNALDWARQPVRGSVAPLVPQSEAIGRVDGDRVSDVLVQYGVGDSRIVSQLNSEAMWLRLVDSASPDACPYIAVPALLRFGPSKAFEEATKKSAKAGDIQSMFNLGSLLYRRGEVAEADDWFAKATATNHPMALTSVGIHLSETGNKAEAEAMIRKAADMGFTPAMDALSDLLQDRGAEDEAESWLRKAAASRYLPAMTNLGTLLYYRRQKPEAEDWVRKAAVAGYLPAIAFLGVILSERGDEAEAEVWLRQAARFGHPIAMTQLGSLLLRREQAAEAELWWRRSASAGQDRAIAFLGTLLKERGEEEEAENLWRKAADDGGPMSAHNMGTLSYERGDTAEAENWLRKAIAGGYTESMSFLAVMLDKRGETGEAEEWWRKAAAAGDSNAMKVLGALLKESGRDAEAEEWWRKAADLGDTAVMTALGNLLEERGETAEAEELWHKAAEAGNEDAAVNLGKLYHNRGETSEAEARWRKAADAGNNYAVSNLALLLWDRGEKDEALSLLRKAAEMNNADGMSNLGALLMERGAVAEAELWMRKAVDAGHSGAMSNLGGQLMDRGEMAEAEPLLRKSADMGHPRGMYNFGQLLHMRGEHAEAERWRQRAAVKEPGREWPEYTD